MNRPRALADVPRARRPATWASARDVARRAGLGAVLGLAALVPGPAAAERAEPTVGLSPSVAAVGDAVTVSLQGWPTGPTLVELCGNEARRGSVDCDVVGAGATTVAADGHGRIQLVLGTPPAPCPCVVRVSSRVEALARTAPIDVPGLPAGAAGIEVPATGAPVRAVEVEELRVVDDAEPAALFGAAATRRLELRIRNTGDVAVTPRLSVSVGDGDAPRAVEVPAVPEIPPGEAAAVRATFHLPALTFGRETVTGRIDGVDQPVRFVTSTATTPWGLLIAGALAAYLLLLRLVVAVVLRVRARRRPPVHLPEPVATGAGTSGEAGAPAPEVTAPSREVTAPVFADAAASGAVARWDLVGGATPELLLAALLDAGAPEDAVRDQLGSLPLRDWRFQVARDGGGTSVIVEVGDAEKLRALGTVGRLLSAGAFTDGTAALARRALRFLAEASPTPGIPAEPGTVLATIGACAAVDALGITDAVCAPVDLGTGRSAGLSPSPVGVEVLRRHGIPWVATLGAAASPGPAALAVLAATMSPSGRVGPAVTAAVGHGHPSPDRVAAPGLARVIVGRPLPADGAATGTDPFPPARSTDRPSASAPRLG